MAKPKTAKGTKLRILVGDDSDPVVYTAFCGLTAKTVNFQTNTNEFFVPDCDNPDDPAWRELAKAGRFVSVSGQGLLDTGALTRMQAGYDSSVSIPLSIELNIPSADGGGSWVGNFMLTQMQITGNDGSLVEAQISFESDGEVAWEAAA